MDWEGILAEVQHNFRGEQFANVRKNLRFASGHIDKIACPLMISNATRIKQRAFPDAIGIGFAKSGTGSLAMLRLVFSNPVLSQKLCQLEIENLARKFRAET